MHPQHAVDAHIVSLPLAIAFFHAMGLRLLPCTVCEDWLMLRGMCAVAAVQRLAPMARKTQQPCTACSRAIWSAQCTPSRVAAHTTPSAETLLQHRWQTQRTFARCGDADVLHNLCEPG
ncbi:PhnB protein [Xanthomonas campestris]|nr:PhnB protein [Xanthomonas campestris]